MIISFRFLTISLGRWPRFIRGKEFNVDGLFCRQFELAFYVRQALSMRPHVWSD